MESKCATPEGMLWFLMNATPLKVGAGGAVITYYLADGWKSLKDSRHEREAEVEKKGGNTFYPSWDSLRAEARELRLRRRAIEPSTWPRDWPSRGL